jgi:hypothetical protein
MCLAPKMPAPPEAPAPPPQAPIPVTEGTKPATIKQPMSQRASLRQASKGPSALTIPLSTGGMTTSTTNLSIGNQ